MFDSGFYIYLQKGTYMNSIEKRCETNSQRYGVVNIAQLKSIQEKRRETFESKRTTILFYQEPRVNVIDGEDLTLFRLNKNVADEWLNLYHPFKAPRGNVLCLGLVNNETIYTVMTFKKSRNPKYVAELSRLWMLPTYQVVNGYDILSNEASKLGLYNIVAYVNMSFENYLDYEAIGMKYIRDVQRTKWWIRNDEKISDTSRRQRGLNQNDLVYQGYHPVYDCGVRVYST